MATKQFKTESKRILDLMVNSIYTHKEIFLRELISNASDALDKLYFESLTNSGLTLNREELNIELSVDGENRTLTIRDNGIGMNKEDLENNLGVIARSGSLAFKQEHEQTENVDVIGQFGVGFYSAFMVAKKVTVRSRAFGADEAYQWQSKGAEGYTIAPCDKEEIGTVITLEIKDNEGEENYDEFLEKHRLASIVKKYSDYIRYPIIMEMEESRKKEGEDAYETVIERKTLNSMIPLWKKDKKDISKEEYTSFYRDNYFDFEEPAKVIHFKVEGAVSYTALLFIPKKAPYDYYTKEFAKGLSLYTSGVMIMDKCAELIPDCFSFVRGLIDSQDLSLNISREMLQHDRQLRTIAKSLEKKIKSELLKMLTEERELYEEFYKSFGLQLKVGAYAGYGQNKELLRDLLMFYSAKEKKMVTLSEYVKAMPEEQKYIYYACGESVHRIEQLPQIELIRQKDYDILFMTDEVDEFAVQILHTQDEKEFRSVSAKDLGLESEEEKKAKEEQNEEKKELLDAIKESLGDKVSAVRISSRLASHPVCLTTDGDLTLEMERVLNAMPVAEKVKASRVLELNANHAVFAVLEKCFLTGDKKKLGDYANILYQQGLLLGGFAIENIAEYTEAVCGLITQENA